MSWQPELDELRRRQEMTRQMGGADKVKRQHDGGRLTVRERIDRLVDKGSFHETGAISGRGEYEANGDLKTLTPACKKGAGSAELTTGAAKLREQLEGAHRTIAELKILSEQAPPRAK